MAVEYDRIKHVAPGGGGAVSGLHRSIVMNVTINAAAIASQPGAGAQRDRGERYCAPASTPALIRFAQFRAACWCYAS